MMAMWQEMRQTMRATMCLYYTLTVNTYTLMVVLLSAIYVACETCQSGASNKELLMCAERGLYLQQMPFLVIEAKNPLQCIGLCKRASLCQSVNYMGKKRHCYLNRVAAPSLINLIPDNAMLYIPVQSSIPNACPDNQIAVPGPRGNTLCNTIANCPVEANYTYDDVSGICFREHEELKYHSGANSTCMIENGELFTASTTVGLPLLEEYNRLGFIFCENNQCWINGPEVQPGYSPTFDADRGGTFRMNNALARAPYLCQILV